MDKGRLEAFSDGVLAIIITIMVLEMKVPLPHQAATLADLKPVLPYFLSYALSYVFVGIYWNNHHHMFQATQRVTGGILWANLHLLFWLSLIPFTTAWMGENNFAPTPTALYGVVLLLAALAYYTLQLTILHAPGGNPVLAEALGSDWKGKVSLVIYAASIALCFVSQWIACALYGVVALIWLVPDRRIERLFASRDNQDHD
jgi:TMEM175 potassium channel family protein